MNLINLLYAVTATLSRCRAASFNEASDVLMYEAIESGLVENLQMALDDYPRDINEKPFTLADGDTETKMSPLEMAISCHNSEIMKYLIVEEHAVIDIDTFEVAFKSSCVDCFDVLLDHSEDLLEWNFNRDLFDRIEKYSVDTEHFFIFVAKFVKRIDFNNKLALIENAFNKCIDHDRILFTVDAVELDLFHKINDPVMLKQRQSLMAYFTRFMVAKMDYVDLLPWANKLLELYPPADDFYSRIEEYASLVKTLDDRTLVIAQPEDFLLKEKNILEIEIFRAMRKDKIEIIGPRVMLKIISGDIESLREDVRGRLPEYLEQRNDTLKYSVVYNSVEFLNLFLEIVHLDAKQIKDLMTSAIFSRATDCLTILIERGFEYNNLDLCRYSIISKAASCLKMLLENSAVRPEQDQLLVYILKMDYSYTVQSDVIGCVKVLLEHGVSPNAADSRNDTVLKLAVEKKLIPIMRFLLAHGANPNIPDHLNMVPLIYALEKGSYEMAVELLNHGANTNVLGIFSGTPLAAALNLRYESTIFMRLLLKHGANPNAKECGSLPLTMAIEKGDISAVRLLLDHKADTNLSNNCGETPLLAAIKKNSFDYVNLILEHGAKPNTTDHFKNIPLMCAIEKGNYQIVKALLQRGANPNIFHPYSYMHDTPLKIAMSSRYNADGLLRVLLEHQADPNIADEKGSTTPLIEAIENDNKECVKLLQEFKADPDLEDGKGKTPLMIAISKHSVHYLNLLIDHGANIYATTETGDTLAKYAQSHWAYDCLEVLLEKGVDIDPKATFGSIRRASVDFFNNLFKQVVNPNSMDEYGSTGRECEDCEEIHSVAKSSLSGVMAAIKANSPESLRTLLKIGVSPDNRGSDGVTPLHYAVKRDLVDCVRILLEYHADSNIKDRNSTALQIVNKITSIETFELLLRYGADPNVTDENGETPLMHSVFDIERVKHLLAHRADVLAVNNEGKSVLEFARGYESYELLRSRGAL